MTTTMRETDPECNGETAGISTLARLLRENVDARVGLEGDFAERERVMHEVANAAVRRAQQADLEEIAEGFDTEEVFVGEQLYRRHERGTVDYHGLSGRMSVSRWTYRQVGVHNGPTTICGLSSGGASRLLASTIG